MGVIFLIIIMRIEEHPDGTGIFDEEEHTHSQLSQLQKEEDSSSTKNLLLFVSAIVLIVISVNYFNIAKTPSIQERKQQIKKQLFEPIREQLPSNIPQSKIKEVHQQSNGQVMTNQLTSIEPLPQGFHEEKGFGQNEGSTEGGSFEPEVPSSPESPQHPVQDKNQKKTDTSKDNKLLVEPVQSSNIPFSVQSKKKTYPISQQIYNRKIYAGQIHYSRIPVQYWQHRILMLKGMGLNTLSVYIMWNYHQVQRDRFDYTTENKNITKFLQLAGKHKMKVLLRPGPYVCAEWDFGGLPARLLGIDGLFIRTANKKYLGEVEIYFKSLAPLIKPYLHANGGPIKMLQIQNELGSAREAPDYTKALVDMWDKLLGVSCQYYIEDAAKQVKKNYVEGAAVGVSDGSHQHDYTLLQTEQILANETFVFGGEVYTGWMTHWGERWGDNSLPKFRSEMEFLFQTQRQFSLYMAHGGTNFGLTAGANSNQFLFDYQPMITSYDYNATISEQGRRTVKSDMIVDMMNMYVRPPTVPFPQPIPTIKFEQITPKLTASLLANLGEPALKGEKKLYFFQHDKLKMYNQGIVVYETFLTTNRYKLDMLIHDFALIFLDGVLVDHRSRISTSEFKSEISCEIAKCRLLILVEAMGHSNYGVQQQEDKKGLLVCDIYISNGEQAEPQLVDSTWNFYKINIDQTILKMDKVSTGSIKFPAILKHQFNLTNPADTYINMKNYSKGYVWVNGRNLGRYWNRGPQFRLYCPGVWLKKENNKIVILQLLSAEEQGINGEHGLVEIKQQQA